MHRTTSTIGHAAGFRNRTGGRVAGDRPGCDHPHMNNVRSDSQTWLDHLHRVGAVVFALGIGTFGVLGLIDRLDMFSTTGRPVLGLSSNGLLSTVSLVVAAILIAAGLRGGRTASTVLVVVGAAFVASGLVNVLVLGTPLNLLAFRIPNVVFSFLAGALLLFLGAWGRFTGRLPDDNPYRRERLPGGEPAPLPAHFDDPDDATAARELAEAERAVARHVADPEVVTRVAAVRAFRSPEDRVREWRRGV
jgi:hypothetical protein